MVLGGCLKGRQGHFRANLPSRKHLVLSSKYVITIQCIFILIFQTVSLKKVDGRDSMAGVTHSLGEIIKY